MTPLLSIFTIRSIASFASSKSASSFSIASFSAHGCSLSKACISLIFRSAYSLSLDLTASGSLAKFFPRRANWIRAVVSALVELPARCWIRHLLISLRITFALLETLGSIAPISLEDFAASRASLSAALFRTTTLSSCFCLVFCGSSFLLLDGVSFDGAFFTGFLPSGVLRSLLSDGLLCSGLALSFLFSLG